MPREELIEGIWDEDIDKYPENYYQFISKCGYACEIKRNGNWVYCGYVQLPNDHPYYDEDYNDITDIQDHGDLTYGQDGKFGFDCGHMLEGDISPQDETLKVKNPELFPQVVSLSGKYHYWTFEEVKEEVENLAQQFKDKEK